MATEFGYLLNAMERAACESNPAKHNYHDKRIAVLGHVSAIEAEIDALRAELAEAQTVKESLIVALDLFGRHSPKGKPCPVCEAIDAAMAGGEHG